MRVTLDGGYYVAKPPVTTSTTSTSTPSSPATFQQRLAAATAAEHAPPLTVTGGLDGIIEHFFVAAEQALQKAQTKLQTDQAAQQTTQSQINDLNTNIDQRGLRPGDINHLNNLNTQLEQENQQIGADQQAVNAAKAKVDAAKMILYADQSQADQKTLNATYTILKQSGVGIKIGDTLPSNVALTPAQQAAYDTYIKALVQLNLDIATSRAAYAELQNFVSDPKTYGTIGADAITALNNALPNGYYVKAPPSIDPATARRNSNDAAQVAGYLGTIFAYYGAVVTDDNATSQLTTDQQALTAYRNAAGYNHAFAYQLAQDDPQYQALLTKVQKDEAALTSAGTAVTQAGTAFTNAQTQILNGLKPELLLDVAQSNLSAAEADLTAVQNEPPQIRYSDLQYATQQVALAKQQLYDVQHGKIDFTQLSNFSNQDLTTALAQVAANHPYLVSVLPQGSLESLGGQLEVNKELILIKTGQIYLTPDEQALASKDLPTLAFIKAAGITIDSSDPSLSPLEQKLAKENPLLFAFMKLGDVHITNGVNNTVTITAGGTDITQQVLQNLSGANPANISSAGPVQLMSGVLPVILPQIEANGNIAALIAATPQVRLDYAKQQIKLLMGGPNPTDQQAQTAMKLLTNLMNGAFSTGERQTIWQDAGAPYFTTQYFESHFNQILNHVDMGHSDQWSSGIAEDKIGEWLQGLLQYASPEAANVILDSIKSSYSLSWNQYVNGGSSSPQGTNFYEALSMAVQLVPSRAQEFAQWLMGNSSGIRLIGIAGAGNYFPVRNAIQDGYGLLSDTIHAQFGSSNSPTAQMFNSTYTQAQKDAGQAQVASYTNNSFNNFDPNKDVPAYFNQFKSDANIEKQVTITSDTQLRDIIGVTLGLTPTDMAAARGGPDGKGDYSVDWYAPGSYQRAVIDLIASWIKQEGGNNPTLTALPMIYNGPDAGVVHGGLFQVREPDGNTVIVDGTPAEQAVLQSNPSVTPSNPVYHDVSPSTDIGVQWHFHDLNDYRNNNHLSRDGTIYVPQNTLFSGGTKGPGYVSYNAHNWTWKDTWNVVTDIAAVTVAITVTVATGGVGGIILGALAGFTAYELSAAGENALTLSQGDDVNNNDQQISLLTPLTNNFGHGGVTSGERGQSYADAAADAIKSTAASLSVGAGGGVTATFEGRVMPALLSRLGVDGLEVAGARAAPEEVQAIIQANAKTAEGWSKFIIRPASGAAGNTVTQAVLGGGQFAATGVEVGYQLSQGEITGDQGWQLLGSAFGNYMFNLATAPVAGAAGGLVSNNLWPQLFMNFAVNAALTEGNEALNGGLKAIKNNWGNDAVTIVVNTVSGAAIHRIGLRNQPKTVNVEDPISGGTVEALYFKGTAPLVKQYALDGIISSDHIYNQQTAIDTQSPKFILVHNPKLEKYLIVPFTADLHAYSPLDRAIALQAAKIAADPRLSAAAYRTLAKQELESKGLLAPEASLVTPAEGAAPGTSYPLVRVRDPLTGNVVTARFPENDSLLQTLRGAGVILSANAIRVSISMDTQGNETGRVEQTGPKARYNLYLQEDGTYRLLPVVAGGSQLHDPQGDGQEATPVPSRNITYVRSDLQSGFYLYKAGGFEVEGFDVGLKPGVVPQQVLQFNEALAYLEQVPLMREIIQRLEQHGISIAIDVGIERFDHTGPRFEYSDEGITWYPTAAAKIPGGALISPALILAHEFIHADGYFEDPDAQIAGYLTPNTQYGNEEEARAVAIERQVATILGEPLRVSRLGDFVYVTGPLDRAGSGVQAPLTGGVERPGGQYNPAVAAGGPQPHGNPDLLGVNAETLVGQHDTWRQMGGVANAARYRYNPAPEEGAFFGELANPAAPAGYATVYVVSGRMPIDAFVMRPGGIDYSRTAVFTSLDDAKNFARGQSFGLPAGDGGWIFKIVAPDQEIGSLGNNGQIGPERIQGALRVYADGEFFPGAAENPKFTGPASIAAAVPAAGGPVETAVLTTADGTPVSANSGESPPVTTAEAAPVIPAAGAIDALINQRADEISQDPGRSGEAAKLLAKQDIEAIVKVRAAQIALEKPGNSPEANWQQASLEYVAFKLESPDYFNWPRMGQPSRLHLGEKLAAMLPAPKPAYLGAATYADLSAHVGVPSGYPHPSMGFTPDNHAMLQAALPELPGAGTDEHYHTYTFNQMKMEFDDWLHKTFRGAGNSVTALAQVLLDKVNSGIKLKPYETVNFVNSVIKMLDPNAEVTLGPVPYYCGGQGHYSAAETQWIRMANLAQLDARTMSDMAALPLRARAQVHGGITAIDFSSTPHVAPIEYTTGLLTDQPLQYAGTGEITFHKEHVEKQRGDELPLNSPIFQDWLRWLAENGPNGFSVVIHSDWSRVGEDEQGRPSPVKGAYENFAQAVEVFSHPDLRDKITVIFAHTGIGRTSRGTDTGPVTIPLTYYEPGNPNAVDDAPTFNNHVELMHYLKEKVPNARFDISWNDVSQNYIDSADLTKKLIQFILKYPKAILNGSDAVRPVNVHQKNQSQNSMAPLLAELALQPGGRNALVRLWTGNYSEIKNAAYDGQIEWYQNAILAQPDVSPAQVERFNQALATYRELQAIREDMRRVQVAEINAWIDKIEGLRDKGVLVFSPDGRLTVQGTPDNPGVFPAHYGSLPGPVSQPGMEPLPGGNWFSRLINRGWAQRGTRTAGGARNDPASNPNPLTQNAIRNFRIGSAAIGGGAVVAEAATYLPGASHLAASLLGQTASEGAFPARGLLLLLRAAWDENTRLSREIITEEGRVTRESLNEFVSPIFRAKSYKGFTDKQLLDVSAATEQFWVNYQYMMSKRLEAGPEAIWTRQQRIQMIMAQVGELQSTLARILNVDPGSLSPFEASAPWGKVQRSAILATYLTNIGVSLQTFTPADFVNPAVFAAKVAFLAGNIVGTGLTGAGAAGGFARRNAEGHPIYQWLQAVNQWVFTGAGAIWAAGDGWSAVTAILASHPIVAAVDVVGLVVKLGYTYAQYRSALTETAKVTAAPMPHTRLSLKTSLILTVSLVIAELLQAAENDGALAALENANFAGGAPKSFNPPAQPGQPAVISIPVPGGSLDQQIADALNGLHPETDTILGDNSRINALDDAVAAGRREISKAEADFRIDNAHLTYNQLQEFLARQAFQNGHGGIDLVNLWTNRVAIAQTEVNNDILAIDNGEAALRQDLAALASATVKRDRDVWE